MNFIDFNFPSINRSCYFSEFSGAILDFVLRVWNSTSLASNVPRPENKGRYRNAVQHYSDLQRSR